MSVPLHTSSATRLAEIVAMRVTGVRGWLAAFALTERYTDTTRTNTPRQLHPAAALVINDQWTRRDATEPDSPQHRLPCSHLQLSVPAVILYGPPELVRRSSWRRGWP